MPRGVVRPGLRVRACPVGLSGQERGSGRALWGCQSRSEGQGVPRGVVRPVVRGGVAVFRCLASPGSAVTAVSHVSPGPVC